ELAGCFAERRFYGLWRVAKLGADASGDNLAEALQVAAKAEAILLDVDIA
nr:hypothetical protein [Tanacetum cinerariifolium]